MRRASGAVGDKEGEVSVLRLWMGGPLGRTGVVEVPSPKIVGVERAENGQIFLSYIGSKGLSNSILSRRDLTAETNRPVLQFTGTRLLETTLITPSFSRDSAGLIFFAKLIWVSALIL